MIKNILLLGTLAVGSGLSMQPQMVETNQKIYENIHIYETTLIDENVQDQVLFTKENFVGTEGTKTLSDLTLKGYMSLSLNNDFKTTNFSSYNAIFNESKYQPDQYFEVDYLNFGNRFGGLHSRVSLQMKREHRTIDNVSGTSYSMRAVYSASGLNSSNKINVFSLTFALHAAEYKWINIES